MEDVVECELKDGQIEVWLDNEMDLANLVGDISAFFLDGKLTGSVIVTPIEKSLQPPKRLPRRTEKNENLVKPVVPPSGVKMWLVEVPVVKDKRALCGFVCEWIRKRGFACCGRHDP